MKQKLKLKYNLEKLTLSQQELIEEILLKIKAILKELKKPRVISYVRAQKKYTDAEAVAAVEAESGLTFTGGLTVGGDLDLAGNDFLTTNLRIRERTTNAFEITARAAATWKHLYLNIAYLSGITSNVTTGQFRCRAIANNRYNFDGWDGAAYVTTASIRGAASPYFEIPYAGDITMLADKKLAIQEGSELTISSAAITVTGSYHTVDTEDNDPTDDLETINGGVEGQILVLRAAHTNRTIVVKNGADNIICGADFSLDTLYDTITLLYDATNDRWMRIFRADNL